MPAVFAAALATTVIATLALVGCGRGNDGEALPQLDGGIRIAETITADHTAFEPDDVAVDRGASVEWTNEDDVAHTVTADDDRFDSGPIAPGESFVLTFDTPTTTTYRCSIHPDMAGTVTIRP